VTASFFSPNSRETASPPKSTHPLFLLPFVSFSSGYPPWLLPFPEQSVLLRSFRHPKFPSQDTSVRNLSASIETNSCHHRTLRPPSHLALSIGFRFFFFSKRTPPHSFKDDRENQGQNETSPALTGLLFSSFPQSDYSWFLFFTVPVLIRILPSTSPS